MSIASASSPASTARTIAAYRDAATWATTLTMPDGALGQVSEVERVVPQ